MPQPIRGTLVLGTTTQGLPFVLKDNAIMQHKLLTGITGMGKSMLVVSMCLQLLNQDIPFLVLDPHGDLCNSILQTLIDEGFYKNQQAYNRLLFFDFGRSDASVPFNMLSDTQYDAYTIARNILETWQRAWPGIADGSAVNLENILLASIVVLVINQQPLTMLGRLLSDASYREQLITAVNDPYIAEFFVTRFAGYGKQAGHLIESTLRRAFLLTFSLPLRYSLGQLENKLQFRDIMDTGTSMLISLANLDEDSKRFLGCLLTVGMEQAALSRANIEDAKRQPYALFIDEFAVFSARSSAAFEEILAQCRKFGLSLNLIHQNWGQVGKKLQSALGNAMNVAFRLSKEDASWGSECFMLFDPYQVKEQIGYRTTYFNMTETRALWEKDLTSLQPREAFVRCNGQTGLIKTVGIPQPTCTQQALQAVKDRYAQVLLTPHTQLAQQASTPVDTSVHASSPSRRKPRISRGWVPLDEET